MDYFLCSYRPISATASGRLAVRLHGLAPFIDGSCRREPDFKADAPSISALCRSDKFAPRLSPGDRVAYITSQRVYGGSPGWCLVAGLKVVERFESHADAAGWYRERGDRLPSNCMVADNPPETYSRTNKLPPAEVAARVAESGDDLLAVRQWDATYAARARSCGVFLACAFEYLELETPPILRHADLRAIFGRIPGTQNPPLITRDQYEALMQFSARRA